MARISPQFQYALNDAACAKHEAAHALRFQRCGWRVTRVSLPESLTEFQWPVAPTALRSTGASPALLREYIQDGVSALLAGSLASCGALDDVSDTDQHHIDTLFLHYPRPAGGIKWRELLSEAEQACKAWLATPAVKWQLKVITNALLVNDELDEEDWNSLIAAMGLTGAAPSHPRTVPTPPPARSRPARPDRPVSVHDDAWFEGAHTHLTPPAPKTYRPYTTYPFAEDWRTGMVPVPAVYVA